MENTTQFVLNDALSQWRETMAASPAFATADLDELEGHLRDSIQSLQTRGLSTQEAFWVARSRLGSSDLLDREFGKVSTNLVWLNRVLWMVAGFIGIGLASELAATLAMLLTYGVYGLLPGNIWKPDLRLVGWLSLTAKSVLVVGLIVWGFRSGTRSEGFIQHLAQHSREHPLLAAVGVFLGYALVRVSKQVPLAFITARTLDAREFGELSLFGAYWSLVLLLVWPSILAWLLVRTSTRATAHQESVHESRTR